MSSHSRYMQHWMHERGSFADERCEGCCRLGADALMCQAQSSSHCTCSMTYM